MVLGLDGAPFRKNQVAACQSSDFAAFHAAASVSFKRQVSVGKIAKAYEAFTTKPKLLELLSSIAGAFPDKATISQPAPPSCPRSRDVHFSSGLGSR